MRSKFILAITFSIGLYSSKLSAQYDTIRIDAQVLVGIWESNDSLKTSVQFVDSLFEIVLIDPSAGRPYYFLMDPFSEKVFQSKNIDSD